MTSADWSEILLQSALYCPLEDRILYDVHILTGDYTQRKHRANELGCVCYYEQHFNASPSAKADYTLCITPLDDARSLGWARDIVAQWSESMGLDLAGTDGVKPGGYDGRGSGNISDLLCPAVLGEPLFVSNPSRAAEVKQFETRRMIADAVVQSIRRLAPGGGPVGLSVGHAYKRSKPQDQGAPVHGGGTEAWYAALVIEQIALELSRLGRDL